MRNAGTLQRAGARSWGATLAGLVPLWLVSWAITAEGFPRPPISIQMATTLLVLAVVLSLVLLWIRWMTLELVAYSLFPILLPYAFDEISTTYKTPFILLCAALLTAGAVGYQRAHWPRLRRIVLLLTAAVVTALLALHAAQAFWAMTGALGYVECFPDAYGCAPLTGRETPWWVLFWSP